MAFRITITVPTYDAVLAVQERLLGAGDMPFAEFTVAIVGEATAPRPPAMRVTAAPKKNSKQKAVTAAPTKNSKPQRAVTAAPKTNSKPKTAPDKQTSRSAILDAINKAGEAGITRDEINQALKAAGYKTTTGNTRLQELKRSGQIVLGQDQRWRAK
jgi:hypothetical protein